ncbi:MAG: hypothetical protein P4L43_06445 [Syntrophobacteraceae bacterium]|nr:hypothetical protein [Syntrophobacteraceae bacterium]
MKREAGSRKQEAGSRKQEAGSRKRGAWSVERGAWSVERGAWSRKKAASRVFSWFLGIPQGQEMLREEAGSGKRGAGRKPRPGSSRGFWVSRRDKKCYEKKREAWSGKKTASRVFSWFLGVPQGQDNAVVDFGSIRRLRPLPGWSCRVAV